MGTFSRIFSRLHSPFNKDPQVINMISVAASGQIGIDSAVMTIKDGSDTSQLDLSTMSISDMADAINAIWPGTATVTGNGTLPARGVIDLALQDAADLKIQYSDSILYKEFQTFGKQLDDQLKRVFDIENQLYLHSATEDWLTFWGDHSFGIKRSVTAETDEQYLTKVVETILAPTQNNVAIEQFVKKAFGIDILLYDAEEDPESWPEQMRPSLPGRIYMQFVDTSVFDNWDGASIQQRIQEIKDLIDTRSRAAGIGWIDRVRLVGPEDGLDETIDMIEDVAVSKAMMLHETFPSQRAIFLNQGLRFNRTHYYDNVHCLRLDSKWRIGTPGIKLGRNDLIKEQIRVCLLDGSNNVINVTLHGG